MKKSIVWSTVLVLTGVGLSSFFYTNCSNNHLDVLPPGFSPNLPAQSNPLAIAAGQANVMSITVGCGYVNEPCVTVTVCVPGTSTCQTIPNVLLDTGSYGLRLFSNVTSDWSTTTPLISLPFMADPANSTNTVTECVSYGDGSADWGPVATADIQLGSETASSIPVQIINPVFATVPTDSTGTPECSNLDTDPISQGFNGILGVGVFVQDCGATCDTNQGGTASNGTYFSCQAGGSCYGLAVPAASQVSNPVASLPVDNNGVIVALTTSVPDAGTTSVNGYLVLGIGTEANNSPSGTTTFLTDGNGNFNTLFGSFNFTGFIDSGSNALYFPQPAALTVCADNPGFYCPSTEVSFTATQNSTVGAGSYQVSFSVANADTELENNSNMVFTNLGGPSNQFDWGLPFFLGRNIYVGIDGATSSAGTGPYWAY